MSWYSNENYTIKRRLRVMLEALLRLALHLKGANEFHVSMGEVPAVLTPPRGWRPPWVVGVKFPMVKKCNRNPKPPTCIQRVASYSRRIQCVDCVPRCWHHVDLYLSRMQRVSWSTACLSSACLTSPIVGNMLVLRGVVVPYK
ncbi:hypothetical protein PIB30_029526 [Stylosanthes scabra]|uniref:Uncharacterized protein n=1 Tax=Stylosanthes scabra TaxID=79078 RepID=A0ABU6UAQ1_9FABA|nr:hypothetical protein [Stylosanthes scabra]